MQHYRIAVLAGAVLTGASVVALAQSRVAPPVHVESAPLAAPPGPAVPAQVQPAQPPNPPAAVPEPVPAPQPVQPAPAPQRPVTPEPVQPPPTPQIPLEPQPVQPPPTLPAPEPAQPLQPPAQQQQTQEQSRTPDPNQTLAGKRGDSSDVDEVMLVAKPVLTLSGSASWDEGFKRLTESFAVLRQEAEKAKLPIAGRPLSLFLETDDNGFRYEAMLPVGRGPGGVRPQSFGNGVRAGTTPAGPSLRFVHIAPYDDIDSTYETITAYLDAKSIVVKDAFLEEYVGDLNDPADPNLEINVYVQPR